MRSSLLGVAPAADMFEMGVELQVLKRGTMFPMRAQKLYEFYRNCDSIDGIPTAERERLEQQVFRQPLEAVWEETVRFFNERDPEVIARAQNHPKRKMALIFRWYLGLSSRWSNHGEAGREADYQIWCGPAMGAFNDWVRGSYLEAPENRRVVEVAYFDEPPPGRDAAREAPWSMLVPLWALVFATVFFGLDTAWTAGFAERAASALAAGGAG